jgi:hypothetical protein
VVIDPVEQFAAPGSLRSADVKPFTPQVSYLLPGR